MKSSHALAKEQEVLRVIEDPTLFAQVMLGHNVWAKQNEILQSVANHARTAVKACHSSTKTFSAAEVARSSVENTLYCLVRCCGGQSRSRSG